MQPVLRSFQLQTSRNKQTDYTALKHRYNYHNKTRILKKFYKCLFISSWISSSQKQSIFFFTPHLWFNRNRTKRHATGQTGRWMTPSCSHLQFMNEPRKKGMQVRGEGAEPGVQVRSGVTLKNILLMSWLIIDGESMRCFNSNTIKIFRSRLFSFPLSLQPIFLPLFCLIFILKAAELSTSSTCFLWTRENPENSPWITVTLKKNCCVSQTWYLTLTLTGTVAWCCSSWVAGSVQNSIKHEQ